MAFGGHEKFAVREDWLPKGLMLLNDSPDAFNNHLFVSDELGIGRNMVKSTQFWMIATGLTEKHNRSAPPEITSLGKTILEHDEYFLDVATWWALHLNLVCTQDRVIAWNWFFNHFSADRFDQLRCSQAFQYYVSHACGRTAAPTTLKNDITCLLSSYATLVPPQNSDPEDRNECPLRALELVTRHCETGTYRINRSRKSIPYEILGYSLSAMLQNEANSDYHQIKFSDALSKPNGPGRTLVLDSDSLIDILGRAEAELGTKLIHLDNSGGERMIRIKGLGSDDWLKRHYRKSRS